MSLLPCAIFIHTYILPTLWQHFFSVFTLNAFRCFSRHNREPFVLHTMLPEQLKRFTLHLVHFKIFKILKHQHSLCYFFLNHIKTLIKTLLKLPSPMFTVLSGCWIFSTCSVEKFYFCFQSAFLMFHYILKWLPPFITAYFFWMHLPCK
jgi:hypothetical protein